MKDEIRIEEKSINCNGYGIIPQLVMKDKRLHFASKAIYAYFRSYTGSGNSCFPTREKICDDLGMSKNTLSKYLQQLIEFNYISIEQAREDGKFSNNIYIIHDHVCGQNTVSHKMGHHNLTPNNNNTINNNNSLDSSTILDSNNKLVNNSYLFNIYGEFKNVFLTDEQYQKLKDKFYNADERIETLSAYIASKGVKYKNHYATILTWARKENKTNTPKRETPVYIDVTDDPHFGE